MAGIDLTLLVPCHGEGARVDDLVAAWRSWRAAHPEVTSELVCVDDGSPDDTRARLEAHGDEVRRVLLPENLGKGAAVRAGMTAARGAVVLFLDADLAVDLTHVETALAAIRGGADLAIGSRALPGALVVRRQGWLRRTLGRGYRRLAVRRLGLAVSDVTCGFKALRRDRVGALVAATGSHRWGMDAELLYLARAAGLRIDEFPVTWRDGRGSRVRLVRDVLGSLRELHAVPRRHPDAAAWAGAASGA